MFSAMRDGVTDFGITISSLCRCHRITTWAGDLPYFSARLVISGSRSSRPPLASGDRALVERGHLGPLGDCRCTSNATRRVACCFVRLVIARCSVDYIGRLTAHLPVATRLLVVKADGSVLVHADGGSYKPLNWMSAPCRLQVANGTWTVTNRAGEQLMISITEVLHDSTHDLGVDPGLVKDGVEAHLQELLARHIQMLGDGCRLVRREYPTAIGPVDILARDRAGQAVAVEIKRRGEIDGVEQLTRYLDLLNRDPLLAPVRGIFAAQEIKPQARVLAEDRGIACLVLDYDALRGIARDDTLF
jgi:endonuclease